MHQFNEHHPELKGFSAFYDAEILPNLSAAESMRRASLKKAYIVGPLIILGTGLAMILGWQFTAHIMGPLFAFVIGFAGASTWFKSLLKPIMSETKENIVGGVCEFLGWSYSEKVQRFPNLNTFKALGLLPSLLTTGRSSFEDYVKGEAHGTAFGFYEAHLEKSYQTKNGRNYKTVFRGQLLTIDFKQKFAGKTVVLRDKGWLQGKKKHDMKRVGLVDPVFENIFEAYGTDQVEARYLLTPTFMQRLVDLEHTVDGRNIRFAFTEGYLLIAVETENRYEPGSMFKPLMDTGRTQNVLDEIGAIYDVIDGVIQR